MTSLAMFLMEIRVGPFFKAGCLEQRVFIRNNPNAGLFAQCFPWRSEMFLIRTHGHASHEHGVHVICPAEPLLPFMCTKLQAAWLPWWANCCREKELFQARVPDGQPFISEEMGAICVLHHGILGDLTQLFKHVNHIFNHAHFQISLCFEVNWNLCGVKGKN